MNARVIWFELSVKDPHKAAKFYEKAFGWEIEPFEGMPDYLLIKTGIGPKGEGPGIDGAVTKNPAAQKVTNTIAVEDIDKAIERAVKAGAKVVRPKASVPKVGFIAYLEDPEGVQFGLIQPRHEHDVITGACA